PPQPFRTEVKSMSSDSPQPDQPNAPSASTVPPEHSSDWFLRVLVKLADHVGLTTWITLVVDGSHVTGELISAGQYASEFKEQFLGGIDTLSESTREAATDLLDAASVALDPKAVHEAAKRQAGDAAVALLEPDFIHLRSARVVHSPEIGLDIRGGALWRFRLASVDGFSLGRQTNELGSM
ncbi:MAG TPA: hypothetical protein VGX78_22500, partial [Pirellulales bacterium]|nr:hypothetical protein [Pirellulales bacterium]